MSDRNHDNSSTVHGEQFIRIAEQSSWDGKCLLTFRADRLVGLRGQLMFFAEDADR